MVIVKVMGGLGNQMFQYAFGRALSIKHNVQLKLDLSWFDTVENNLHRIFELDIFNTRYGIATRRELRLFNQIYSNAANRLYARIMKKVKSAENITEERAGLYNPSVFLNKPPLHLTGYWQSEKYFIDIKDTIVGDFTFKRNPFGKNFETINSIIENESVSVHVRRGDYVTDFKALNSRGGICNENYYTKSINLLRGKVTSPVFYFFSDDIGWVKKHVITKYESYYIEWNGGKSGWEDLRLMSLCKHHIIANSTFSWWGAWLSSNPNKIVIAPRKWFSDEEIRRRETIDIIPDGWVQI